MKKVKEIAGAVGLVLCVYLIMGLFAAQCSRLMRKTVRYETGPTIRDTIRYIEPVKVERPETSLLPVRRDTVYVDRVLYTREVVDTAAIIADYELISAGKSVFA